MVRFLLNPCPSALMSTFSRQIEDFHEVGMENAFHLQNRTPLISFVIAGKGKEKHMLSILLKKSNLTDSITTAGGTRHKTNYSQGEIRHSSLKEHNITLNKYAF